MTSLPRHTNKGRWKGLFHYQEKFQQSIHSRQFQKISFKSNKECSCFLESFQLTVFALEAVWITIVNPRQSGLSSIHPIQKFIYQKINILYKCHLKKQIFLLQNLCMSMNSIFASEKSTCLYMTLLINVYCKWG